MRANWGRRWLMLAGLAGLTVGCEPAPEPRKEPLVHSAYVWRQGWDARPVEGLGREVIPASVTELNLLVGECGLAGGTREVRVPWEAVKASGRKVAISVRIGVRRTKDGAPLDNLKDGMDLAQRGLTAAKTKGVEVTEVQFDYDCPTRLLSDYASWIRQARQQLADVRVTVTTLPTWLGSEGFEKLVAAADGWTLQVHGTERPTANRPAPLMKAEDALGWIRQGMLLGRPFRVALPTYSYVACFSAKGRYLGMKAEGVALPEGTATTQCMTGDPREVAKVLKALQDGRYGLVTAVDWFRLPLPGDAQAWTVEGLGKVIAGKEVGAELTFEQRRQGPLVDIILRNATEQPLPLPSVRVSWKGAGLVGADATLDWEAKPAKGAGEVGEVVFERRAAAGYLAPGASRVVGWVRLGEERGARSGERGGDEVRVEVGVGE